jgi:6-phosphogluconate dehydrogenase
MAERTCDIGLIGLAVMGQNLVLNMNDHGYKVCVFNRTTSKVDEFLADEAKGTLVEGSHSIEEMCSKLKSPRRVMIMVKAGDVVDKTIDSIVPFLDPGDIIIDGGNSLFTDSNRRTKDLAAKGLLYIGTGVSGGEEGARFGPSIMPGGDPAAWPAVKEIFQAIASTAICS